MKRVGLWRLTLVLSLLPELGISSPSCSDNHDGLKTLKLWAKKILLYYIVFSKYFMNMGQKQ